MERRGRGRGKKKRRQYFKINLWVCVTAGRFIPVPISRYCTVPEEVQVACQANHPQRQTPMTATTAMEQMEQMSLSICKLQEQAT